MSGYHDDLDDERPTRLSRRVMAGAILSCVAVLAFTGHEPTDNGRKATPVARLCWVEANDQLPEGVELINGPATLRPARSVIVTCPR